MKKKYRVTFNGRAKGAIGRSSNFQVTVSADSPQQAILKLYDEYDHIHMPQVAEVKETHEQQR